MTTRSLLFFLLFTPAILGAQKACKFDTAGHTDLLTLELSVVAFRGDDSAASPLLTRGLGDLLRGHFSPPPSFGGLLYPNTYYRDTDRPRFTSYFGSVQFDMTPQGSADSIGWYAASLDQATDSAFETAIRTAVLSDDFKLIAGSTGWTARETVRVQLLVTQDTALVHSPLARIKVPMLRVDSRPVPTDRLAVPKDELMKLSNAPPVEIELTVDETGKAQKSSIQIVAAPSPIAARTMMLMMLARDWAPARIGKCPVALRFGARSR